MRLVVEQCGQDGAQIEIRNRAGATVRVLVENIHPPMEDRVAYVEVSVNGLIVLEDEFSGAKREQGA